MFYKFSFLLLLPTLTLHCCCASLSLLILNISIHKVYLLRMCICNEQLLYCSFHSSELCVLNAGILFSNYWKTKCMKYMQLQK
jgi:hypothetical protein